MVEFILIDDKAENSLATSLGSSSRQKQSLQLRKGRASLTENEILDEVVHLFRLQTTTEMKTLEVAKACIGQNATKRDINRYLHHLTGAGILRVTYQENSVKTKSDPRWSVLPEIKDITEKKNRRTGSKNEMRFKKCIHIRFCVYSGLTAEDISQCLVVQVGCHWPYRNELVVKMQDFIKDIPLLKGKARLRPTIYAHTHPFSKGTQNQKNVLPSIIRTEVSKSVGLLHIEGQPVGTGFRVGEKYLMTCAHVIQNVRDTSHMIDGERLTIEFYRITYMYNKKEDDLYGFQPWIAYFEDDHDFVVLELRSHDDDARFPPPLTSFADVFDSEIHLVGHPGGRQMKEDNVVPRWSPDHDKEIIQYIKGLARWSKSYFPDQRDYYSVLLEPPRKIMFHTTFDTGSSGSPGEMIRKNKPCVVVMVRGGTPSCFYENLFPQLPVEDKRKVEYGYAMSDIYLKMSKSTQQKIRDLAAKIFGEWI